MKLTIGSLFAGIGGLERGLEMTGGFITKWQVENDPYCLRVLRKHWPHAKRFQDVTQFAATPASAWSVDIITGGFPCQPVSLAGKQKGESDERWLWEEMRRVCEILRPRWIVGENVRGLLSADAGRLFGRILGDLASLGYRVEWESIQAAAFGAPHGRERVFIVAHTQSKGSHGDIEILGGAERQRPCLCSWWRTEPKLDRVANGIPRRIYEPRLKVLGNAVVPHVAKWIGQRILEAEQWLNETSLGNTTLSTDPT